MHKKQMKHNQRVAHENINWKKQYAVFLSIYLALALPLILDIWGIRNATHVEIYGRITLSFIVLVVVCPLFALSTMFIVYRLKNAIQRKSFCEFVFPTEYSWIDLQEMDTSSHEMQSLRRRGSL